MIRITTEL